MATEGKKRRLKEMRGETAEAALAVGTDLSARLVDLVYPGAGVPAGAVAALAGHLINRHAQQKLTELVEAIRHRVESLDGQGKLDQERLVTIEAQLVRSIIVAVPDDPEKVRHYADLLAGFVSSERPDELDENALLSVLQALSVQEIGLASEFVRLYESDRFAAASGIVAPSWGPDSGFYMKRLEGNGLIAAVTDSGRYELMPTLIRLVATLRAGRPAERLPTPADLEARSTEDDHACCVYGQPAVHKLVPSGPDDLLGR